MPIRPITDNIVTGAEAAGSGAANRTRSVNAASSRVNQMGEVLGITSDILKNEEVMKTLPKDLQARLQLGEPAAMLEATMYVMQGGGIPKYIPRDRALSKFPGGEAGFQMGKDGGRVPVASAGELIPAGQRGWSATQAAKRGSKWVVIFRHRTSTRQGWSQGVAALFRSACSLGGKPVE